jgi:hypothetical protein
MTLRDQSTVEFLGHLLLQHQASIHIEYRGHWGVKLANPRGRTLYIHACEEAENWPHPGKESSLAKTIAKAIACAENEGWW